ncbi:MAG: Spy/CpxP family protein refolding chaperone [Syntrophobacteraceae bacterium]
MLKKALCVLLAVGCLSTTPVVSARETPIGPGRWWRLPLVSQRLDLTEDHKRRLDELFVQNRRKLIDLRSGLERDRLDLEALIDKEPLDENAVMAGFKRLENARGALAVEKFRYFLEVRKILGVDRFRRLEALYGAFRDRLRRGFSQRDDGDDLE